MEIITQNQQKLINVVITYNTYAVHVLSFQRQFTLYLKRKSSSGKLSNVTSRFLTHQLAVSVLRPAMNTGLDHMIIAI
jgi:hypothetical protein